MSEAPLDRLTAILRVCPPPPLLRLPRPPSIRPPFPVRPVPAPAEHPSMFITRTPQFPGALHRARYWEARRTNSRWSALSPNVRNPEPHSQFDQPKTRVPIKWILHRCRSKREQLERFAGFLPESKGQNLASTDSYVPYSLDPS